MTLQISFSVIITFQWNFLLALSPQWNKQALAQPFPITVALHFCFYVHLWLGGNVKIVYWWISSDSSRKGFYFLAFVRYAFRVPPNNLVFFYFYMTLVFISYLVKYFFCWELVHSIFTLYCKLVYKNWSLLMSDETLQ